MNVATGVGAVSIWEPTEDVEEGFRNYVATHSLTPAMADFVRAFDRGEYPELLRAGTRGWKQKLASLAPKTGISNA